MKVASLGTPGRIWSALGTGRFGRLLSEGDCDEGTGNPATTLAEIGKNIADQIVVNPKQIPQEIWRILTLVSFCKCDRHHS